MSQSIDTVLHETRSFSSPKSFSTEAILGDENKYEKIWNDAQKNPVQFWEQAAQEIHWFKKWDKTLEWDAPFAKWFVGGKTNASYNCLDKHVKAGSGDKKALIWEGEDGETKTFTYLELLTEVSKLSHVLETDLKLKAGDTAAIYMPLVPEAVFAMLACARIGVTHSVIFAGFSANAIRDRVIDANCKAVLTSDIGFRRGKKLKLSETVKEAVSELESVENVLVLKRESSTTFMGKERDWQELVADKPTTHQAAQLDSEHPLFILYTSGTTGKPKGIVHSTGGYLVGTNRTSKWIFDLKDQDTYWCTADIGWVTGHSYVVYGILSNGATSVIYEGAPTYPTMGRVWEICDKHKVSILYTAPTAIRAFMRAGDEPVEKADLSSLRLLGTVGEPINPEAWMWYHEKVGKGKCPIVDTWWQTETGAIMISPLPGVTTTKPGSATRPFPGICADIVDEEGKSCQPNEGGYLVITHPWPSMLRNIFGDTERFKETYWSKFPGVYFAGDGAHKDEKGYFWIKGRVDDVLNVSGHRLGTMEIESALVSHTDVAEAAVVGKPHETTGECIVAYVIPKAGARLDDVNALETSLKAHVVSEIGAIARPQKVFLTKSLPKTRSGKIMRRLLKDLAAGREASGDTTTLENQNLVELIE